MAASISLIHSLLSCIQVTAHLFLRECQLCCALSRLDSETGAAFRRCDLRVFSTQMQGFGRLLEILGAGKKLEVLAVKDGEMLLLSFRLQISCLCR